MGVDLCTYRARVWCHHARAATPKRNKRLSVIDVICISLIIRYYSVWLSLVLYLNFNCGILIEQYINHYVCDNLDITNAASRVKFLSCQSINNSYFSILLIMAGDIAENPGPGNPISICYLNAQSMYNKLDSIPDSKGTLAQHSTNIMSCVGPTLAFYIGPMWFCSSAHNWANMLVKSWANVWNITNNV